MQRFSTGCTIYNEIIPPRRLSVNQKRDANHTYSDIIQLYVPVMPVKDDFRHGIDMDDIKISDRWKTMAFGQDLPDGLSDPRQHYRFPTGFHRRRGFCYHGQIASGIWNPLHTSNSCGTSNVYVKFQTFEKYIYWSTDQVYQAFSEKAWAALLNVTPDTKPN